MPELEVRVPYSAWVGDADPAVHRGWEQPSEALMNDVEAALDEAGLGEQDDPDHTNEYISYILIGDDVPALAQLASDVLAPHGVLQHATAVIVDTDGWDDEADTFAEPEETVVELPAPREPA